MATMKHEDNATLEKLKESILELENASLKAIHKSETLAIDARTGKTMVGVNSKKMDIGTDFDNRTHIRHMEAAISSLEEIELPVKLVFDGRNS
jgi:hypothetical protein